MVMLILIILINMYTFIYIYIYIYYNRNVLYDILCYEISSDVIIYLA